MSPKTGRCMQRGPNLSALRTPCQLPAGCGGFQRSSPTGGAAKGTPLKLRTPVLLSAAPSSVPPVSLTRSWAKAPAASVAIKRVAITNNLLRSAAFI
jgi:hypothetical protein